MRPSRPITEQPSREDWIRLAAYIDGEGSITIPSGKGSASALAVQVYNTDPRLSLWCRFIFGGSIGNQDRRGRRRKTLFRWSVSSSRAEWVVRNCIDFSLIKKEQMAIAIAFRETFRPRGGKAIPVEVAQQRADFSRAITDLKIHGVEAYMTQ